MTLLSKATVKLIETYHSYSPSFRYTTQIKDFGMVLTTPAEGVANGGHDNANGDYIFRVGDVICSPDTIGSITPRHYVVESLLGHGSFGQVFRCLCQETYQTFAVKVIKNLPPYTKQAALEKKILEEIKNADPKDEKHMLRLCEIFYLKDIFASSQMYLGWICIHI